MKIEITEVGENSIDRATKLLAGINGGADRAVKSAMIRATQHLRTKSADRVREKYAISKKNLRMQENIRFQYQYSQGQFTSYVMYSNEKIPLYRYDKTSPVNPTRAAGTKAHALLNGWKTVTPSVPARAHQKIDTAPFTFERAFVTKLKSGHVGIFERTGNNFPNQSDKITEIMGNSISQMVGNQEVQEKLAQDAKDKFDERLDHEISRILNGWKQ